MGNSGADLGIPEQRPSLRPRKGAFKAANTRVTLMGPHIPIVLYEVCLCVLSPTAFGGEMVSFPIYRQGN